MIFVTLASSSAIVLHRTWIGRQVYAVGKSTGAARFSGVRVQRLRMSLFVLSGAVAALAGVILTSRLSSARADAGQGMTLTVVTVVLLGGVNIFGGRGTIPGVVLAVLVVAVMQNALRLANVTVEVQSIALGLLLILSVVIPTFAHQAKSAVDRVAPGPATAVRLRSQLVSKRRLSSGGGTLEAHTHRAVRGSRSRGIAALGLLAARARRRRRRRPSRRRPPRRRHRPTPRPVRPPAAAIDVGYLPKDIVNQYFAAAKTGIDKAAGELGGTVTQVGPNEAKADLQIPFITDLTTQGVDAIIISADGKDEVAPALKAAMDAGHQGRRLRLEPGGRRLQRVRQPGGLQRRRRQPRRVDLRDRPGLHGRLRDPVGRRDGDQPEQLDRGHEGDPRLRPEVREASSSSTPSTATTTRPRAPSRPRRC